MRRAYQDGTLDGVEFAITTVLWILNDKHDCPAEDVKVLCQELRELWDELGQGNKYVTFDEIRAALKQEYDYEFGWTDNGVPVRRAR